MRRDGPDLTGIDAVVVMGEHDAEPGHVAPLDGRVVTPALVAHCARRLADDLEQSLDGEAHDEVGIELGPPRSTSCAS